MHFDDLEIPTGMTNEQIACKVGHVFDVAYARNNQFADDMIFLYSDHDADRKANRLTRGLLEDCKTCLRYLAGILLQADVQKIPEAKRNQFATAKQKLDLEIQAWMEKCDETLGAHSPDNFVATEITGITFNAKFTFGSILSA